MTQGALALALSFFLFGTAPQPQSQQSTPATQEEASAAQQVPNAPTPSGLTNLRDRVKPGAGTAAAQVPNPQQAPSPNDQQPPANTSNGTATAGPQSDNFQQKPPQVPKSYDEAQAYVFHTNVNYVDVPVTVRDKHHQLVAGLTWREFKVYEDGQRQRLAFFTTDPYPLSVAFVIDQSLPSDIMHKVNQSLGAVSGAFGPADSVAVLTYNSSPTVVTAFTGSQGPRLQAALQSAKRTGRSMGIPTVDGPFASGPTINGHSVDPNLDMQRGNSGPFLNLPKEVHPLNDAILAAARLLSQQPRGRRRIIYVVTDGKEAGSKASQKEVIQYLLTNNISVYGTIVGDSALWGIGYLDKVHLPLLPTNNVMPRYAVMTGGSLESEISENGIQKSFSAITNSLRTQYTLGYYSHQPTLSEKRHTINVTINVPGLDVTAKQYYYPSRASVER